MYSGEFHINNGIAITKLIKNHIGYLTLCGEPKLNYDKLYGDEKKITFTIDADSQSYSVLF